MSHRDAAFVQEAVEAALVAAQALEIKGVITADADFATIPAPAERENGWTYRCPAGNPTPVTDNTVAPPQTFQPGDEFFWVTGGTNWVNLGPGLAKGIGYDNSSTLLAATNVQDAIDQIFLPPRRLPLRSAAGPAVALNVNTDCVVAVDTTPGPTVVTVPLASSVPASPYIQEYYIWNFGGGNPLTIQLTGPDTFPQGHTKIELPSIGDVIQIGVVGGGGWGSIGRQEVYIQVGRAAAWVAANFPAPGAPVPFDTLFQEQNDEILDWDVASPTLIQAKVQGLYRVSYWFSIQSLGAPTWNCTAQLRKNGVTPLPESLITTGNFGGEDQGTSIGTVLVPLLAGETLELVLSHSGPLNGQLIDATVSASIII